MYKHGAYAEQGASMGLIPPAGVSTLPIYIGTAPVDQLDDYTGTVNVPLLVNSFEEAKTKLGYNDDWGKYTLCEAMYAHFMNKIGSIGPVIMVNVFDPDTHTDIDDVTYSHIVGGIDANGNRTGLSCIELVYQMYGMIPSLIAAPGWSYESTVGAAMLSKCQKINGHWDALSVIDIDSSTAHTIAAAKTAKQTNAFTSKHQKVCWPKVKSGDKIFWLSTLTVVRSQQTDYENDNVPYESPSNKPVDATGAVLDDGSSIYLDEVQANSLNESGITTLNFRGGRWVLWGPHCGNYSSAAEVDPSEVSDASIRMLMYLTNTFQQRYAKDIDAPLNRSMVDTILNDANTWLNGLIAEGKLLYGKVVFNQSGNPINSIISGDFAFDVTTTTTPVGKSISFKVQYSSEGINVLFGGEA